MSQQLWRALPTYLALGMSAEEFWHGDHRLAAAYREAGKLRRERGLFAEWRAGVYVALAMAAAWSKDAEYPELPLFLAEDSPAREAAERARMEANVARMEARMAAINARFGGGE